MKVAVLVLVFGEWLRTREGKNMWEPQMPWKQSGKAALRSICRI